MDNTVFLRGGAIIKLVKIYNGQRHLNHNFLTLSTDFGKYFMRCFVLQTTHLCDFIYIRTKDCEVTKKVELNRFSYNNDYGIGLEEKIKILLFSCFPALF